MVGKRASSSDDQLFFSMPDNAQPEQYQTFVFDGNTYKSIGPFDTEEELFNALKEYTDTEVEAGTMSQAEATALLEKYQQKSAARRQKKKAVVQQTHFYAPMKRRLNFQSRRFSLDIQ